jgi:hypothetical protein
MKHTLKFYIVPQNDQFFIASKLDDEDVRKRTLDTTLRDACIKQVGWMEDSRIEIYTKEPLPRPFARYLSKIGRENGNLVSFRLA